MKRFQPSPWHAMAISITALFVALGGAGYAAFSLPKNSVGTNQIQNGAVSTAKLGNGAVTKNKLNVTGVTVPNAVQARSANSAKTLAAPEPVHLVGAPGEPGFQHGWANEGSDFEPAGFYKDQEGIVHLQGAITGGGGFAIFQLPPGYRPDRHTLSYFPVACDCTDDFAGPQGSTIFDGEAPGRVVIFGSGWSAGSNGAVELYNSDLPSGNMLSLNGISFRAAS
jgi:hypothetical protein